MKMDKVLRKKYKAITQILFDRIHPTPWMQKGKNGTWTFKNATTHWCARRPGAKLVTPNIKNVSIDPGQAH
jgi:hypothetical protein